MSLKDMDLKDVWEWVMGLFTRRGDERTRQAKLVHDEMHQEVDRVTGRLTRDAAEMRRSLALIKTRQHLVQRRPQS